MFRLEALHEFRDQNALQTSQAHSNVVVLNLFSFIASILFYTIVTHWQLLHFPFEALYTLATKLDSYTHESTDCNLNLHDLQISRQEEKTHTRTHI